MNDKVKGLVLNIADYKENDLILQVITEDKSFLSLIAKGAKKVSGKNHYLILCLYEFIIDYKDNKTIYSIHNAKVIHSFYEDANLKLMSFKNILLELTLKNKETYSTELYDNLLFTLSNLNEKNMYLLGNLYISFLLKINGINPEVDHCVVCQDSKVVGISSRFGGFLCINHLGQETMRDVDTLKKFRLINKAKYKNYDVIKDIEFNYNDFVIMMDFYINNSDMNIKSYKLFREMFGI